MVAIAQDKPISVQEKIDSSPGVDNPLDTSFNEIRQNQASTVNELRQVFGGMFVKPQGAFTETQNSNDVASTISGVKDVNLSEAVSFAGQAAYDTVYQYLSQMGVDQDTKMDLAMQAKQLAEYTARGADGSQSTSEKVIELNKKIREIVEEHLEKEQNTLEQEEKNDLDQKQMAERQELKTSQSSLDIKNNPLIKEELLFDNLTQNNIIETRFQTIKENALDELRDLAQTAIAEQQVEDLFASPNRNQAKKSSVDDIFASLKTLAA